MAGALFLIPLETEINQGAHPERRSRDFGLYAVCIALGVAAGVGLGPQIYSVMPRIAFLLGGVVTVPATAVLWIWLPQASRANDAGGPCPALGFAHNLLNYGSAWAQGFLEGGMMGHLAVYLTALGLSESDAGWLMGGLLVGVLVSQMPIAWLADHLGRTRVLLACYVTTLITLTFMPFCGVTTWLVIGLVLSATCSTAFYPLGLSLLGEKIPSSATARGNARYLMFNCLGSLTGPALSGIAMDLFGKPALFSTAEAAVLVVLLAWSVQHYGWRRNKQRQPSLLPVGECYTSGRE